MGGDCCCAELHAWRSTTDTVGIVSRRSLSRQTNAGAIVTIHPLHVLQRRITRHLKKRLGPGSLLGGAIYRRWWTDRLVDAPAYTAGVCDGAKPIEELSDPF